MAELNYLDPKQRESLDGLPFAVLLPSETVVGWALQGFSFEQGEEEDAGDSFTLSFVNSKGGIMSFLTTNGGIGDPVGGARTSVHRHPQLGEITVEHEEDGDFLSDWLEVENGFSAVSGRDVSDEDLDLFVSKLIAK